MKDTKNNLFLELAKPDIETGSSRWVSASEFVGRYKSLELGNGGSWCRKESTLAKVYIIEFDKNQTSGNRIDRIRLNGFNKEDLGSQQIRSDIRKVIKNQRCVVLGTSNPEVDHKNGRKNDLRVMTLETQTLDDFQPLSKAANDAKRQFCKECRNTGNRYDAKKLGYPISFTKGQLKYENDLGCVGCFWYDPIDFRKNLKEIDESIIHKILNI
ncbi:MAG: restriction endonuclease [Acidobacteriota bacterium]|nr:restriction endonuclease [Acidobacteriota bacterium]